MKSIVEGKQVELTDWFPPHIKPVRPGWYHTGNWHHCPVWDEIKESRFNWYWDGKSWKESENSFESVCQDRWWRGLTKPWEGK